MFCTYLRYFLFSLTIGVWVQSVNAAADMKADTYALSTPLAADYLIEALQDHFVEMQPELMRLSAAELQASLKDLFESLDSALKNSLVLREARKEWRNQFLGGYDYAVMKGAKRAGTGDKYVVLQQETFRYYKAVLNKLQELIRCEAGGLSPRRGAAVSSHGLSGITVNEEVEWQRLTPERLYYCAYYSIYSALCYVAEREGIKEPGLIFNNPKKFKQLLDVWVDAIAGDKAFADRVNYGMRRGKADLVVRPMPDYCESYIVQLLSEGRGGVSKQLGEALKNHCVTFSRNAASSDPLLNCLGADSSFGEYYADNIKHKRIKEWLPLHSIENIRQFRKGELSYVVVLAVNDDAEEEGGLSGEGNCNHQFAILYQRDKSTAEVRAEIADSDVAVLNRELVKRYYEEILNNKLLDIAAVALEEAAPSQAPREAMRAYLMSEESWLSDDEIEARLNDHFGPARGGVSSGAGAGARAGAGAGE